MRQTAPQKTRFEVFKRDNFTCQYCGRKAPEVVLNADHIKPVSKGGSSEIANLTTSCRECNSGKGDRLIMREYKTTACLSITALTKAEQHRRLNYRFAKRRFSEFIHDSFLEAYSNFNKMRVSHGEIEQIINCVDDFDGFIDKVREYREEV